jgi:hypothetical protein
MDILSKSQKGSIELWMKTNFKLESNLLELII